MTKFKQLVCGLALLLFCAVAVRADVPSEMNVQGRLTNAGGGPAPAGFKQFTFKIFDQETGGAEIWPAGPGETQILTTDINGLWIAGVGQTIPLTEAVFLSPVRWLEVTVNDGVNPSETLPHIELRTHPYTYRSATSQNADSLAGLSIFDIADRFVDTSGDVMTGPLSLDWVHHNLGSSVSIDNHNDAWNPHWNDDLGFGTWGVVTDVNGDGNNFNVGVATAARGNSHTVDGNYGVLSYADGTGIVNYGISASTGMSGTNNYSGYFANGDFVVTVPQTPGTGGVMLPDDAIDHSEILDEPGIAQGRNSGSVALGSDNLAWTTITSLEITTPVDGYIHLHGRCYMEFSGGTSGQAFLQVSDVANGPSASGIYSLVTGTIAATHWDDLCNHRTYFKAAGTHTFYLEGLENYTGTVDAGYATLTAMFFPQSYGAVSTVVAQGEQGDFASASRTLAQGPAAGMPDQSQNAAPQFDVDLRELELKVARAEAEVERARRELIEAQASSVQGSGPSRGMVSGEPRR